MFFQPASYRYCSGAYVFKACKYSIYQVNNEAFVKRPQKLDKNFIYNACSNYFMNIPKELSEHWIAGTSPTSKNFTGLWKHCCVLHLQERSRSVSYVDLAWIYFSHGGNRQCLSPGVWGLWFYEKFQYFLSQVSLRG